MLKWLFYFTLLIIFLITLINVVFTKVLDNIFNPILLLYQRLSIKFMSSKIVFEETNLKKQKYECELMKIKDLKEKNDKIDKNVKNEKKEKTDKVDKKEKKEDKKIKKFIGRKMKRFSKKKKK